MSEYHDIVRREELAHKNLIDILQEYGAGEFAEDVADLYLKEKIAVLDVNIGKCQIKHGGFLEAAVINRAIEMVGGQS